MDKMAMAEGAQHAVAKGAITGAAVSVPSVLLGAQVDALVIGLCAAVFVSIWLEQIDSRIKAAAAVLFSALLAGYGSPVAASYAASQVDVLGGNPDALRLLLAFLIGGAAPTCIPIALRYIGKKGEAL